TGDRIRVDILIRADHVVEAKSGQDFLSPRAGKPLQALGILQQFQDSACERIAISRRDQHSVDSFINDFWYTADPCGQDRSTEIKSLGQHEPERFSQARKNDEISRCDQIGRVVAKTQKYHHFIAANSADHFSISGIETSLARYKQPHALRSAVAYFGQSLKEVMVSFFRMEPGENQQQVFILHSKFPADAFSRVRT